MMLDDLIKWLPVLLISSGLLIVLVIAVKYRLPDISMRLGKVEEMAHNKDVGKEDLADYAKKNDVYLDDGNLKFPTNNQCERTHKVLVETLEIHRKNILDMIVKADKKREIARHETSERMKEFSREINYMRGRVDEWLRYSKKNNRG